MKIYFQLLLLFTISFQSSIHDEIIKRSLLQHIIQDNPEFNQSTLTCGSCKIVMKRILSFSQTKLVSFIKTEFEKLCPKVETVDICSGINQTFIDQFLSHFLNHYLDPVNACARIGICEYTYSKQTLEEFIDKYLNQNQLIDQQQWTKIAKSKILNNKDFNILHLADLHVDLEYQVGANIECPNGFCCRQESGMAQDKNEGAQYWGTRAACDVPLRTVTNLLEYVSEKIKPDFIIWTGDSAAHDVWHQQASNQTLPTKLITDEIKKIMPNTQLYGIFGNHEAYPADQYDVTGDDHKWLREELANMWSQYLTQESYDTLKEKGYYAQSDKQRNLKLIALNSQVCDNYNFYLFDHITDPTNQLDWLYRELLKSENEHQFAYIFAHIPPGDNSCHSQWSQRFAVIIERFEHVVTGLFYGHTHSDHLQHIRSQIDGRYLKTVFIVPSGTTHEYQNPSFRIFEIDGLDNQVRDYVQYRFDLDQANKEQQSNLFYWYPAYRFTKAYNLNNAKLDQTQLLPQLLMNNDILFTEYIYNYVTGSDILYQEILKDLRNPLYTESTKQYYICSANTGVFEDWFNCVGILEKIKENSFISRKIFDLLGGNWINEKQ